MTTLDADSGAEAGFSRFFAPTWGVGMVDMQGEHLLLSVEPQDEPRTPRRYWVWRIGEDAPMVELDFGRFAHNGRPQFSPDGSAVIFAAAAGSDGAPLWRFDLTTKQWDAVRTWRGINGSTDNPAVSGNGCRAVIASRPNDRKLSTRL